MASGNRGKFLSFQTVEKVRKLRNEGKSIQEIVEITKLSSATVVKYSRGLKTSDIEYRKIWIEIYRLQIKIESLEKIIVKCRKELKTKISKKKTNDKNINDLKSLF